MLGLNRLSKPLKMSPQSVRRNNKFVLVKVSNLWIGVKTQRVNLAICPIFVPNSGFLRFPNRPLLCTYIQTDVFVGLRIDILEILTVVH